MMVLLGDVVTVQRNVGGEVVYVTGRISGLVQNDAGDLERFHIKGLDTALWVMHGWRFETESEYEMEMEDE